MEVVVRTWRYAEEGELKERKGGIRDHKKGQDMKDFALSARLGAYFHVKRPNASASTLSLPCVILYRFEFWYNSHVGRFSRYRYM